MVASDLPGIKQQITQKHQKCLQQQALLQELEGLLQDALSCVEAAGSEKASDKELKRQGFKCSHQVYQAAFDHLQVANCAQRLQLPVLPQATMISADQSVAGSVSHLLGVTPQQLLQVQVPDLPAAQKGCQALISELESRLQYKLHWLLDLCDFKGDAADLAQHVAAQVAATKDGRQELLVQWQQQQHASRDHLQALQQAVACLTELVEGHLLGQQQEADQVQQQWLEAHGQTLSAKLQVIEKQLLAMTYTSETVPALQKIDAELTKKQRQLDAKDQQVSAKLCRFDALGPNFVELTARYRDLQEDLDHANFTLQEFRKAAEEEL